ncbi:hypothetical protein [Streptomyces corynorhini]|uniref:hypothetical protein n=1 Tax=Streptomyces corynorhini TaxID=2282652 RepID=UPI0011C07246|nr:hypothetical protein [Streptomyces corynorhini]
MRRASADGTQQPRQPQQPRRKNVLEQWGGTSGMIYMTLPVVAFVVANSLLGLDGARSHSSAR